MTKTTHDGPAKEQAFPPSQIAINEYASLSSALHAILCSGEITRIVAAYKREDQRALDVQRKFFDAATHLNAAALATVVIGAVILALGVLKPWLQTEFPTYATQLEYLVLGTLGTLGFVGLIVGGYAAARLYELNAGDLANDWMRSRARAEQLRSEYFDRVVARAAAGDGAVQEKTLDFVVKHLLEDQLNYFADRGKRHEAAAGKWLRWAAFATGAASVGVGAGGMAGAGGAPWIMAIAALGAIGSGVAAFANAQGSIGQERERAERFRNNVDALELLARKIDDVREAVRAGSSQSMVTFTGAVNQQLALELGRFLEGGESIRASVAKLGQEIEESRRGAKTQDDHAPGAAS